MFESTVTRKVTAGLLALMMQHSALPAKAISAPDKVQDTSAIVQQQTLTAKDLKVSAISVSCLKVTWTAEKDRDYTVTVEALAPDYAYIDNAYFVFHGNDTCYLTGLRENNEYKITVEPELKANEKYTVKPISKNCRTEKVEVIEEFPHEDGWTNAMSYERAGGLTRQPSSGAIYGSVPDPITGTGIRRDEYGDYCCAMGLFYGTCGDRFLVELENGTQFTVKICDSKGWADDADGDGIPDGRFHWFGNSGKSVIEFIHDGYNPPSCVRFTGNYGCFNWNGLDLGANISSIKKINYGEPVTY